MMYLPIRSLLFAPANEERKTRRLSDSGADAVVLDLEDAVADVAKIAARGAAVEALSAIDGPLRCVRVNPITTRWGAGDIAAVVCERLQALVVPKIEHCRDLQIVHELLSLAERDAGLAPGSVALIPLVETCMGVSRAADILTWKTRVIAAALGTGDLGTDINRPVLRADLSAALQHGRGSFVYAARASGHQGIIDGPSLEFRDDAALARDCQAAAALGFTGKVCVHPGQVRVANQSFAPAPDEIAFARKVITAFEAAEAAGSAAIDVDGVFIDYPIFFKARRIVSLADILAATDKTGENNA